MKNRRAANLLAHAAILSAIGCGLAACSSRTPEAQSADTGARLFSGSCAACHQQNGQGIPGVFPSLVGSPVVQGDPAVLARWVINGQRPLSMPPGRYPTVMLQFGWMKDAEAAALFTYLRTHFANHASAVDAASVASARRQ